MPAENSGFGKRGSYQKKHNVTGMVENEKEGLFGPRGSESPFTTSFNSIVTGDLACLRNLVESEEKGGTRTF